MSPSISARMSISRARALVLALPLMLAAMPAVAQTSGPYPSPAWGQAGAPAWGQYNNAVGAGGWQYNQTLKSNDPKGAVLNPNQVGAGATVITRTLRRRSN